jgi:LCP family protein required for cell wall assembly
VLGAGAVVVLFSLLGASVAGYVLVKYQSIDRIDDIPLDQAAKGEPENFLIVGVDTREGHTTRNTDTIMVVRIDPKSERVALTSLPRDLMVPIADTGRLGQINAAYARDEGERVLIDTIRQNFDITIHHFVEVNWDSFRQAVDAVDGVSVWIPYPIRDRASGLHLYTPGCVTLDGETGLAFARARKMEIRTENGWQKDPKSDLNRVLRQQIFVRRAMTKVLAQVGANPLRSHELLDLAVSNVRLDRELSLGDLRDLGDQFRGFDPGNLEAYPLPTDPWPRNPNRVVLREAEAEPIINVFRGLPPGEIRPGLVTVNVLNGTVADEAQTVEGLASDVSGALQRVGFQMAAADDADTFHAQTTIEHAPGQAGYAQRVARHVTSDAAIPLRENPDLEPGHVTLIAGADFTTVHEIATPIEEMPSPAGTDQTATDPTATTAAPTTTTTTAPPAARPTVTTVPDPYVVGAPPEGEEC